MMMSRTRAHPLGFKEVLPKPTKEELERHYNDKYFAGNHKQYSSHYTDEEILHKRIQCLEALHFATKGADSVLDIGCGEGFFLSHFARLGWRAQGADFTLDGIRRFFPELEGRVCAGNIFETIDRFSREGITYDLVACNNVLEHVIDPLALLKKIKPLLAKKGVFRLIVPNDDSYLQHELVRRNFAQPDFWVCPPEHLNFFNVETFSSIIKAAGFDLKLLLSEFPIDMFLFNPDSNYQLDPAKGKNCHYSRVMIENLIAAQSIEKLVAFRKGCAEAGIGRDLVAYCTL